MKKPVIFLDRDGVLCKEKSYVSTVEELEIFSYASDAVDIFHSLGFSVIVITNQSGIARRLFKEEVLLQMNKKLKKITNVDEIYYCPHYPPEEGEEELLPYKINCNCRKPKTGLIYKAEADWNVDLKNAYFVGDRASDIQTGASVGATTVLLESGYGSSRLEIDVKPDLKFEDLFEFAQYLERKRQNVI